MKTLVRLQFGSHVYGTNLPTSDIDYKAIHVPPAREILLGNARQSINTSRPKAHGEKNNAGDVDFESYTLQKFLAMALDGQTVALSMLYTPKEWWLETSKEWEFLIANRHYWLSKNVSAFVGYCRQQANKYGIKGSRVAAARHAVEFFSKYQPHTKLKDIWKEIEDTFTNQDHCSFSGEHMRGSENHPVQMLSVCDRKVQEHISVKEAHRIYKHVFDEYGQRALQAENNENVDWKACMHAIRVSYEAEELLTTGNITYPRPERELLIAVRKGEKPYKEVAELLESRLERLEKVRDESLLPEEGNKEIAELFILDTYKKEIIKL